MENEKEEQRYKDSNGEIIKVLTEVSSTILLYFKNSDTQIQFICIE